MKNFKYLGVLIDDQWNGSNKIKRLVEILNLQKHRTKSRNESKIYQMIFMVYIIICSRDLDHQKCRQEKN